MNGHRPGGDRGTRSRPERCVLSAAAMVPDSTTSPRVTGDQPPPRAAGSNAYAR